MALGVYLATLGGAPVPGGPVSYVVQFLDILPRLEPRHPLWWGMGKLALGLPLAESQVMRLHLLSAVCGAATIGLVYALVTGFVRTAVRPGRAHALRAAVAARVAGVGSAVFLAFSVPFWMAATRTLPLTLDLTLLVVLGLLLLRYLRYPSVVLLGVIGLSFGVGIVEYVSLVLYVPFFGVIILMSMWEREEFRPSHLMLAAGAGLLGLLLYPLVAWSFYGSPGYELREYGSFFKVVWIMWRDQYYELTRSLPRVGWLIVVLVTVTPALTVPVVARRALNAEKDWALLLLHLVLTVLAVGVLFNVRFAPWAMSAGRVQVGPYLIHACLFGYLLAYWFLLPLVWWENAELRWQKTLCVVLGWLLVVPGAAAMLIAPFRNMPHADPRPARFISRYADLMLDSLEGRQWVVTDGSVDDHLRIAAHERGMDVEILNLYAQPQDISLRYVVDRLPSVRLRNLAETDMMTLVYDWLRTRPEARDNVAMMPVPDFWVGAGATVLPHQLLFFGVDDLSGRSSDELIATHREFWRKLLDVMPAEDATPERYQRLHVHYMRHAGFVANNLGFLLQELGDDKAAFEAYAAARRIDADNVSALLNQAAMVSQGFDTPEAEQIQSDFDALKARRDGRSRDLWSLSRRYGYVRSADAFAQSGFMWAMSGRPGMAASGLQTALDLASAEDRRRMQLTLADIHYLRDQDTASADLYRDVLRDDPDNAAALLGMVRLQRRRDNLASAEEYLKRLDATGEFRSETALQWALLNVAAGDVVQARITLEELVSLDHEQPRAWDLLARIAMAQGDSMGVEDAIRGLRSVPGADGYVYGLEAEVAIRERDYERASRLLEQALRVRPRSLGLHERILRLDVVRRDMDSARQHALRLLKQDPGSAWANYVIGTVYYANGEYEQAEDAWRRSLERDRLAPALNDLAYLLLTVRDMPAEAEALARESVETDPRPHNGWDTLALTLMEQNKLKETEVALAEAVKRTRTDPYVYFHSARLLAKQGATRQALGLLDMLLAKRSTLPEELERDVDALRRELSP